MNTATSPKVQYAYAAGASAGGSSSSSSSSGSLVPASFNTIRPISVTYPNGRVLNYSYGTSGAMDDALSRIASLVDNDGTTHLADYTRLGLGSIVQVAYPQPLLAYSLINGSGADPYSGLDQFGRVVDCRWFNTGTLADVERVRHGYDRASSRLWRKAPVAAAAGVNLDELYLYDGLYRLRDMQRGALNSMQTAITTGTEVFAQAWGLDATGNWKNFLQDDTGGGAWNLNQSRTHSAFNEITGITGGGWIVPVYDQAGNMVTMPQPAAPPSGFIATCDAWNRLMMLSSGMTAIAANVYDGLNRRVTKTVSGTARHYYYSAAWQVLEERLGSSTTSDRQFVWGLRYIDDLVLRDAASYVRLYGLQDPNFNLTAVSDASGTIQERYTYTAYGLPTVLTASFGSRASSSFDWDTHFAGYRWDSESSLYSVRNRDQHPALGIFITRDRHGDIAVEGFRINEQDQDMSAFALRPLINALIHVTIVPPTLPRQLFSNRYSYVDDCPIRRVDPAGLDWLDNITNNWFYKLLYTGDSNISDEEYRRNLIPAGEYTLCYTNCVKDVNAELAPIIIPGVGAELGGLYTASDVLPYPKAFAKLQGWNTKGFDRSENILTSRARLKSACRQYTTEQSRAYKRLAELIKRGPRGQRLREIAMRAKPGAKAGAKRGLAVLAIIEILIAGYCADKCGAFD